MPFRNLFFRRFTPLRDHNFSDFLDRLDEVKEVFLEAKFREGYREGTIEPYFDPVIPLSLSPTSCLSFLRAYAKWPITERDYYLSKLFQYLYLPIEIRYGIDYHDEDRVRRRLEGILFQARSPTRSCASSIAGTGGRSIRILASWTWMSSVTVSPSGWGISPEAYDRACRSGKVCKVVLRVSEGGEVVNPRMSSEIRSS